MMAGLPPKYPDKVVVVTGARRGIGRLVAMHFLKEGAKVIGFSRGKGSIEHPGYSHLTVDIRDAGQVRQAFLTIMRTSAAVDILINNAAVLTSLYAMVLPAGSAQKMVETNLLGTFYVSREAAKIMKKSKRGRIVNIGSMASALEPAGDSIYAASKAGMISLAGVLAREFAPFNITCNTVSVTAIETDMMNQIPREKLDAIIHGLPIPRYAQEDDILNVIDFFASGRSSYITGQNIFLGGVH